MEVKHSEFEELVKRWAPVVVLHPDEGYFPCSIEFYLNYSALWKQTAPGNQVMLLKSTHRQDLAKNDADNNYLQIDSDHWKGQGFNSTTLEQVPFYVHVTQNNEGYKLEYYFMFCFNGPFPVCGCFCCGSVGAHKYDLEHITIQVDEKGANPIRLYYGAHGTKDGLWLKPKEVEWYNGTHPYVYCARYSHAAYPKPGTILRAFCVANDHASDAGLFWFPNHQEVITENTDWNRFLGGFETYQDGDPPLRHQSWTFEDQPGSGDLPVSTNCFLRFCCPCI